jgi:3-phosphoshikimate 1-carboxyvinyltransferase
MLPPEIQIIPASEPLDAQVNVPGSKSITNRALLLAALAEGRSVLQSVLLSDDTDAMASALRALGIMLHVDEPRRNIYVQGTRGRIPATQADLNIGGAGTAMRFLTGMLTLGWGRYRLDGNARMRQRPIGPLLDVLGRLGIDARSEDGNSCPPVLIETPSAGFAGGDAEIDANVSSQFVSALLMPAPLWSNGLRLTVNGKAGQPFIEMTLRLMRRWGVQNSARGNLITIPGGQRYSAMTFVVEPDATGASYFAAAAALVGGSVRIPGLSRDSVQGDVQFLDILQTMGARVLWESGSVEVSGDGKLVGIDVAMGAMPDVVPTLAAIAPFASSPTRIRDVGFIRHHESDRIHALATELSRLGARVQEFSDGLKIMPSVLRPDAIETYGDHRIAMAFAVLGLKLAGVRIKDPGCVTKTYPEFFGHLALLQKRKAASS